MKNRGLGFYFSTCFFSKFSQNNWIFFSHAVTHQLYKAIYYFTVRSLRLLLNLVLGTLQNLTSNLPATLGVFNLWTKLQAVIYYFSPGTNNLPVCAWMFTVKVGCLVCRTGRNVCSQNGVRIN